MRHLILNATAGFLLLANTAATPSLAADIEPRTALKAFDVTIRVFDPTKANDAGQDYVLPVDSPDAEHAAASTLANAASFTKKIDGGKPLPVAFTCTKVEPR